MSSSSLVPDIDLREWFSSIKPYLPSRESYHHFIRSYLIPFLAILCLVPSILMTLATVVIQHLSTHISMLTHILDTYFANLYDSSKFHDNMHQALDSIV